MADTRYCIEYAKTGRSGCKKCKQTIEKGVSRVGKVTANPFSDDGGEMKQWYHLPCVFETFTRARATTKVVESPADLDGFTDLRDEDKEEVKKFIKDLSAKRASSPSKGKGKGKSPLKQPALPPPSSGAVSSPLSKSKKKKEDIQDTFVSPSSASGGSGGVSFADFQKLCGAVENEPSFNAKTKIVQDFLERNAMEDPAEVHLLAVMLLPGVGKKRVYNLQSKQIVKLLSQIFSCDVDDMVEDLGKGDVAETAVTFFHESSGVSPSAKSTLALSEVDSFLDRMAILTKEEEQTRELRGIVRRCTEGDLRYIIRLLKNDLRMNAGAKLVLDAIDPNAHPAFQASHDLQDVITRALRRKSVGDEEEVDGRHVPGMKKTLSIKLSLMTPVKPMLAEACKSVAMAMKKCPNGMFAEIKYDGERVQIHKQGSAFQFFSRSLKAVTPHKVAHIKDYLPKACPHGDSIILDSEVLMVDLKTGKPLPFGTLGVHKKNAFKDAACCLFIFDILYFNGENLLSKPMDDRRRVLEKNVTPIKNRIMFSEQTLVTKPEQLQELMGTAIKQGLEGLVLKDLKGVYEPGKRHWLKMKKDYLAGGTMADSADLVVLGAYYGTGSKGGLMSVFLMGVYDQSRRQWCTVAKCGNGHDDATIVRLQRELKMRRIGKDPGKVPSWLVVHKNLLPDFVVEDPKEAPVWEISGAEFTKSTTHTAAGISIRFPRVTRIRDDKDWKTATNLDRLKLLYDESKEATDVDVPSGSKPQRHDGNDEDDGDDDNDDIMDTSDRPSSSSGTKRQQCHEENPGGYAAGSTPPSKRPKPMGKYGTKSNLKSDNHRTKFAHPVLTKERKEVKTPVSGEEGNPLPNLFSKLKVYVHSESVEHAKELRRYLIAYDGEVVNEYQLSEATHIISEAPVSGTPSGIPSVKPEWIWESLKAGRLLAEDKYRF